MYNSFKSMHLSHAITLVIFCLSISTAFANPGERQQIIENELNCIDAALHEEPSVTWADVCETTTPEFTIESVKRRKHREDAMDKALQNADGERVPTAQETVSEKNISTQADG